jgi:hypothetical protein
MEIAMFEFLFGVVTHTPAWVWVLFIFLISRGIKARRRHRYAGEACRSFRQYF